ncbi:hypothetical protein C8R43DRAFT_496437 [Mycena crocata]|nr:hypothetical protein C8R43DRAFT_496437 [Mycena crocata]
MSNFMPPVQEAFIRDRSVVSAAGVAISAVEKLGPETSRHFDCDPTTGEVLWFPAPPMHVARTPSPRHRLEYLHFLAQKYRPEASEEMLGTQAVMNVYTKDHSDVSVDRKKVEHVSASETIREALRSVVPS